MFMKSIQEHVRSISYPHNDSNSCNFYNVLKVNIENKTLEVHGKTDLSFFFRVLCYSKFWIIHPLSLTYDLMQISIMI